jgi:hypothetical protein
MYLRFVIIHIDEDSHQPQGVFIAAGDLLDSGDLNAEDHKDLREILDWFNSNLPVPRRPNITGRTTFWFKVSAQECIERMWALVHFLRRHDRLIEVHKCTHLYNIVYSDEFQVAAYPHRHDGKRTVK